MLVEIPTKVGDKLKFAEEKRPFKIRALNSRFVICTQPFNLKKTVFYTVIDLKKNIRGTENLIFGMGAETHNECIEMLQRLTAGETDISHRNNIKCNIERIIKP